MEVPAPDPAAVMVREGRPAPAERPAPAVVSATGGTTGTGGVKGTGGVTGTGGTVGHRRRDGHRRHLRDGGDDGNGRNVQGTGGSGIGGAKASGGTTGSGGTTSTGGTTGTGGIQGTGGHAGAAGSGTGGSATGGSSGTCPATTTLKVGDNNESITSGGESRTFIVHLPTGYTGSSPAPVILDFHPLGGTGSSQEGSSGWKAKCDSVGCIAVFPDSSKTAGDNSWNAGYCCDNAEAKKIDDVQFARDIIKYLEANACVDPKRIYASGGSNGGGMTYRMACEAADVIAAVAPVDFRCVTGKDPLASTVTASNNTACTCTLPRPIAVDRMGRGGGHLDRPLRRRPDAELEDGLSPRLELRGNRLLERRRELRHLGEVRHVHRLGDHRPEQLTLQDLLILLGQHPGQPLHDDQRRSPRRLRELVGEVHRHLLERAEDPDVAVGPALDAASSAAASVRAPGRASR